MEPAVRQVHPRVQKQRKRQLSKERIFGSEWGQIKRVNPIKMGHCFQNGSLFPGHGNSVDLTDCTCFPSPLFPCPASCFKLHPEHRTGSVLGKRLRVILHVPRFTRFTQGQQTPFALFTIKVPSGRFSQISIFLGLQNLPYQCKVHILFNILFRGKFT